MKKYIIPIILIVFAFYFVDTYVLSPLIYKKLNTDTISVVIVKKNVCSKELYNEDMMKKLSTANSEDMKLVKSYLGTFMLEEVKNELSLDMGCHYSMVIDDYLYIDISDEGYLYNSQTNRTYRIVKGDFKFLELLLP